MAATRARPGAVQSRPAADGTVLGRALVSPGGLWTLHSLASAGSDGAARSGDIGRYSGGKATNCILAGCVPLPPHGPSVLAPAGICRCQPRRLTRLRAPCPP